MNDLSANRITVLILLIISGGVLLFFISAPVADPVPLAVTAAPKVVPAVKIVPIVITHPDATELLADVNVERVNANEAPLVLDQRLVASATDKCNDMVRLNEWGHDLSDGTTPFTFISKQYGLAYSYIYGENLTWGWNTSAMVTSKWMNSPGHKANILNAGFTHVGYATCASPKYPNMVVQQFEG